MTKLSLKAFVTRQGVIRAFVGRHADWIVQKLGCQMDETVLLESDFPVVQLAATRVLSEVSLLRFQTAVMQEM